MPVQTATEVPNDSRVYALRQRHGELSRKIIEAQNSLSSTDFYIKQLKKQKLMVKEKLFEQERRQAG